MLRVRYPDGTVVRYNNANFLSYESDGWSLYQKQGENKKKWICSIQNGAGVIVEAVPACGVERGSLDSVVRDLREFRDFGELRQLAMLKRALMKFDAKKKSWKE